MKRRYLDSRSLLYSIMELICAVLYCFPLVVGHLIVVNMFIFPRSREGRGN